LARPTEHRLIDAQQALRWGVSVETVAAKSGIDPWFLDQVSLINQVAEEVAAADALSGKVLARAKRHGLSDEQIGEIRGLSEEAVREIRHAFGLRPVYKMVDTCAGEFAAQTPYLYSTYEQETEVRPRTKPAVLILGSGPNRIGQGIEFDYSCVHASLVLGQDYETVMVNCNPETVSTDYDISDRLYFEPLTFEDVMEVYEAERQAGPVAGVIVQLGGQTPLSLASRLAEAGLPMWGTPPEAIDAAENRGLFGQVLAEAGLPAPPYGTALSVAEARTVADRIGYPVLVRPSYVLGGRGMEIVYDPAQLEEYMAKALPAGGRADAPVLIDRFLDDAIEIDVDALFDGQELFLGGVMEHIEEAGVHSGDSACVLPPVTLSGRDIERIRASTEAIARGVGVRGLINIQFALMSDVLYVLEANPRASRTVPFVSKATGVPLAKAACLIMAGRSIAELKAEGRLPAVDSAAALETGNMSVKEAVLPFARFRTAEGKIVDTVLGPEMRSTGEVMGRDRDFPTAFAKAQVAANGGLPRRGNVFVSVADRDKRSIIFPVKRLAELGFAILATEGTASVLRRNGITCREVAKVSDAVQTGDAVPLAAQPRRTVVDLINSGEVDMVVNTPSGAGARADGYEIRAAITAMDRPIVTTTQQLAAAVQAIEAQAAGPLAVAPLQAEEATT
jgi:carbamoyl-phosphate synthase large subunit